MKCKYCGYEMRQGARFCAGCGKPAAGKFPRKWIILISAIAGTVLIAALVTIIVLETNRIRDTEKSIARSNLLKWAQEAKKENLMSYLRITGTSSAKEATGAVKNTSGDLTIYGYVEVKFMKGKTVVGTASIFLPASGLKPGESCKYTARSFNVKGSHDSLQYDEGALYTK